MKISAQTHLPKTYGVCDDQATIWSSTRLDQVTGEIEGAKSFSLRPGKSPEMPCPMLPPDPVGQEWWTTRGTLREIAAASPYLLSSVRRLGGRLELRQHLHIPSQVIKDQHKGPPTNTKARVGTPHKLQYHHHRLCFRNLLHEPWYDIPGLIVSSVYMYFFD